MAVLRQGIHRDGFGPEKAKNWTELAVLRGKYTVLTPLGLPGIRIDPITDDAGRRGSKTARFVRRNTGPRGGCIGRGGP